MFEADWREPADNTGTSASWPRLLRPGFRFFSEASFAEQYRLLQVLSGTTIPVPPVHWHEPDPAVLGAP